ncbi:MAG: glutathione S-transferase, partial [Rhizobacter sp.]|nr:glutathione S-transferase [Rhizobacter sp.]
IGLALAACEKSVQIVYEHNVRPPEKWHQPWLDRVTGQLLAAYGALEAELQREPPVVTSRTIDQAGVTAAVVWHFTQQLLPGVVAGSAHPALQSLSLKAETMLPEFMAAPHGEGIYPVLA